MPITAVVVLVCGIYKMELRLIIMGQCRPWILSVIRNSYSCFWNRNQKII